MIDGNKGALLEVNAETDFVARNEIFQGFVEAATKLSLSTSGDLETLKSINMSGEGRNVADQITHLTATIGENIQLRRSAELSVETGIVASYMHSAVKPNIGKIGVLVALESDGDSRQLLEFGKQVAMHIAAASPRFLSIDDVDADTQLRERQVLTDQAKESGRSEEVIGKMVDGRMRKFFEEVVLLEQGYVISEDKVKVSKIIESKGKELGAAIKITGFSRFVLGEGIEREAKDFAAEVAEAVGV